MELFGFSILQLAGELPSFAVLVAALVLAAIRRDRLPRRVRRLLSWGALVLIVASAVTLAWNVAIPHLVGSDWFRDGGFARISALGVLVSAAGWVGFPVGTGLLVAAALADRRPTDAPADPWGSWTPPAADAAPSTAPGGTGTTPPASQWGATDLPSSAPGRD